MKYLVQNQQIRIEPAEPFDAYLLKFYEKKM